MSFFNTGLSRYRAHLIVSLSMAAFASIFVTVALSGFHNPTPHDLPVGVVGPRPIASRLVHGLGVHARGAFDLRTLPSGARAREQITHHDIDAALIATPKGLTLLTAEAGGTAPTQAITGAFAALAAKSGQRLATTDIVPPGPNDSQALSSFFLVLCTLFASLGAGVAAGHALRDSPLPARLLVLLGVAGIAGLAAAGIGDAISGLGHYWAIAGAVALFSLAVSAPTAALGHLRPPLAALGVLAFLIFGIPVSGGPPNLAAFGPSFLRSLTEELPLGIAANTIRDSAYFHDGHTTGHVLVLAAYAVGGAIALSLLALAPRWRRSGQPNCPEDAATATELVAASQPQG